MARDLVYGTISRDWAVGALLDLPSKQQLASDARARLEVEPLARAVEAETQAAFQLVARLSSEGKLSTAERRALKPTMQKWFALRDRRRGKFQGEDYVELASLRDAARAYRRKISSLDVPREKNSDSSISPAKGLGIPLLVLSGGVAIALLSSLRK